MPRSPARDLSDRYIGYRGYFRRSDPIRRGKYALMGVAVLAVGAWAAADVYRPERAAYAHTHGPLAAPHAHFDDNCAACHVPHGSGEFTAASVFAARDRWHDLTCEKCHGGPTHHDATTQAGRDFHTRCSNCHHDHGGRMNSLVHISDSHCTKCHANLGAWHSTGQLRYAAKVTNFAADHPEFRPLVEPKPPARTLKFSHAVHMNPGQAYQAGGKETMTLARLRNISGAAAERYRRPGQDDNAPVQLDCASCHQLDPGAGTPGFDRLRDALDARGEPTRALLPARAAGAYFLGVNFEAHCRTCHPLRAPDGTSEAGGKTFVVPGFDVPHRKQPDALLADLQAGYLKGLVAKDPSLLKPPPQPGGKIDAPPPALARTVGETDRLAGFARQLLFSADTGCAKCHQTGGTGEALRVAPVPDRTVWFTHAKFNHAAHRATACATCHPGTGGAYSTGGKVIDNEPVQILGVESCRACHSPAGTRVTLPDGTQLTGGGIRHNCTDCHGYHNGDHPLQGRGAATRLPAKPLDLGGFLRGK